jgi:imidazoleglycerol phosphate dehydratase HisB
MRMHTPADAAFPSFVSLQVDHFFMSLSNTSGMTLHIRKARARTQRRARSLCASA